MVWRMGRERWSTERRRLRREGWSVERRRLRGKGGSIEEGRGRNICGWKLGVKLWGPSRIGRRVIVTTLVAGFWWAWWKTGTTVCWGRGSGSQWGWSMLSGRSWCRLFAFLSSKTVGRKRRLLLTTHVNCTDIPDPSLPIANTDPITGRFQLMHNKILKLRSGAICGPISLLATKGEIFSNNKTLLCSSMCEKSC